MVKVPHLVLLFVFNVMPTRMVVPTPCGCDAIPVYANDFSDVGCDRLNITGDNVVAEAYVLDVDNAMGRKAYPGNYYMIPCARGRKSTSSGYYHLWSRCDWNNQLGGFDPGDCQRINGKCTNG